MLIDGNDGGATTSPFRDLPLEPRGYNARDYLRFDFNLQLYNERWPLRCQAVKLSKL